MKEPETAKNSPEKTRWVTEVYTHLSASNFYLNQVKVVFYSRWLKARIKYSNYSSW